MRRTGWLLTAYMTLASCATTVPIDCGAPEPDDSPCRAGRARTYGLDMGSGIFRVAAYPSPADLGGSDGLT